MLKGTKEKIIQIAFMEGNLNPVCLTDKGRILMITYNNPVYPEWQDITPDIEKIKKVGQK